MRRIILATKNRGKTRELEAIFADLPVEIVSMLDAGIDIDVVEDGDSFEANALKKAIEIQSLTGGMVIADDSGLEVDALGGAPGVYSARYGGCDTDQARNALLIENLRGVADGDRAARFVCAAALVADGVRHVVRGTVEGRIGHAPSGSDGFGYDPLFLVDGYPEGTTMAHLSLVEKNRISHRGKAMRLLHDRLMRTAADTSDADTPAGEEYTPAADDFIPPANADTSAAKVDAVLKGG